MPAARIATRAAAAAGLHAAKQSLMPPAAAALIRFLCGGPGFGPARSGETILGDEAQLAAARRSLDEAIRRLVAEAVEEGGIIRSGPEAARLAGAYGTSGLSGAEIAERLARAAVAAGVPTELGRSP